MGANPTEGKYIFSKQERVNIMFEDENISAVEEKEFVDETLVCKDCGNEFVFTAGEQKFYAEKGFQNEPTRCKACRQARKASRAAGAPRQMFDAICAECGKPTQVPFEPKEDRPVYCSECFAARRG